MKSRPARRRFVLNPPSPYLYVREFPRDAGRYIRTANAHSWRQPFALIPPLTPMRLTEKTKMFPISKNTHGDPRTLRNRHWQSIWHSSNPNWPGLSRPSRRLTGLAALTRRAVSSRRIQFVCIISSQQRPCPLSHAASSFTGGLSATRAIATDSPCCSFNSPR